MNIQYCIFSKSGKNYFHALNIHRMKGTVFLNSVRARLERTPSVDENWFELYSVNQNNALHCIRI